MYKRLIKKAGMMQGRCKYEGLHKRTVVPLQGIVVV